MARTRSQLEATEELEGRYRQFKGPVAVFIKALGILVCLFALLYVSGSLAYAGVYFLENQYNAIFLASVLTLIFLLVPAGKKSPRDRVPWYDILLILAGLAGNLYIFVNALALAQFTKISASPLEIALAAIIIPTLMEAVRRTMGWGMIIVSGAFLAYAKLGYLVSGPLHVYHYTWSSLTADFYLSSMGIYGSLLTLGGTIIIAFIVFGVFFTRAGAGRLFMNCALALCGHVRGGPAKVAVIGSALFGTISGNPSANVMATGTVTIPLMKKCGYEPHFAGAVEATASTGGMIMPPVMGAIAFVMAGILNITYASVCLMAAIPAFLYFASVYFQIDFHAARAGLHGVPRKELPSIKQALRKGWELTIPLLVLIVLLFALKYDASTAAVYTVLSVIFVSLFRKENRLNLRRIIDGLYEGMTATMGIAAILGLAGIIVGALVGTGLGPIISLGLVTLFGGNMLFLVIAAALTCYVMGMGVSMIASYVLVSALVAPALLSFGVPLDVTHFFILYMVTSTFITPPYAPAAYVAATIARAHPFRIGFQAMRLGIVCYLVPFIIIYDPVLLMKGTPGEIALGTITALVGIMALSAGIEGYLFTRASWVQRILLLGSGLLMIVPGLLTDLIGAGILALLFLWQWRSQKGRAVLPARVASEATKTEPQG